MEAEEKVWIGAQTIKNSDLFDLTVKALRILKSSRLRSKIVHGKAHLLAGEDTGKTEPAANKKNNLSRHKSLQKDEIKGNAISLVCLLAMLMLVGMLPANPSVVTKNLVVVLPPTSEPAKSNLQPYPFPMPPSSLPQRFPSNPLMGSKC